MWRKNSKWLNKKTHLHLGKYLMTDPCRKDCNNSGKRGGVLSISRGENGSLGKIHFL